MKKLMLVSFALALVMSLLALAQEYPQSGDGNDPEHEKMSGHQPRGSGP